jgi:hypothetical protein
MREFLIAAAVIVTVKVVVHVSLNAIARKCFETQAPASR